MAAVRIGPKHQVTIPQEVFETLKLNVRDFLDARVQGGQVVHTPTQLASKVPAARLTPAEQRTLTRAKAKIDRIRQNLLRARGLAPGDAQVAAKAGLIDPDQAYSWTEA